MKLPQAILVAELKGFSALATSLAERVDGVGITPDRIRSAARTYIANAIPMAIASSGVKPIQDKKIGGDTWYFSFHNSTEAAKFGSHLLALILELSISGGLYYLKPSMAVNCGIPRVSGDCFLDDQSILAYKTADKGEPFALAVLPEARDSLTAEMQRYIIANGTSTLLDWRKYSKKLDIPDARGALHLSSLLTDSDVLHFASNREVVRQVMLQQETASVIRIFGGAIQCEEAEYSKYAQAAVNLIRKKRVECVVQNYFTPSPSPSNYAWLRACQRLARDYPDKFVYSAYILPNEAVRPIAYHLYDDTVFLFLRRYNELRNAVSMGGSILLRNTRLSQQLREHFVEGVKTTTLFNRKAFQDFEAQFGFSKETIAKGNELFEKLFKK